MNKKIVYYSVIVILIIVGIIGSLKLERYEKQQTEIKNSQLTESEEKLNIDMEYSNSTTSQNKSEKSFENNKTSSENSITDLSMININQATYLDMRKRGISANIAQRIVYFRELHGEISHWNQLDTIQGIGAKSIERFQKTFTLSSISTHPKKFSLTELNENLLYAMGISRKSVKVILSYQESYGSITSINTLESLVSSKEFENIKLYLK